MATFVELKHNLLLNYCSFLSFYLLIKIDKTKSHDDIREHPVLFKLTALKQTLDGLAPLDAKLEKAIKSKNFKLPEVIQSDDEEFEEEENDLEDDHEEGEEELEEEQDSS